MTKNNSRYRRDQRRAEAEARASRSSVIDCDCGKRHADDWAGCQHTADHPGERLLRAIFGAES